MKAFIHEYDEQTGMDKLGSDHAIVTREYKNSNTMWRLAIEPFLKSHGTAHVEIFNNWDSRYGKADREAFYSLK